MRLLLPQINVLPTVILLLCNLITHAQNNHTPKAKKNNGIDDNTKATVSEGKPDVNSTALARAEKRVDASQNATHFEKNKGQIKQTNGESAPYVTYAFNEGNTSIFLLREGGIAWQFNRRHYPNDYEELTAKRHPTPEERQKLNNLRDKVRLETYRMDMHLKDANPNARMTTEGKSDDYTNYYNHDALNVHHYRKVTYHNVYPGIDWVIRTTEEGMKYNFVVQPGADPSQIEIRFTHQEELYVDEEGRLVQANRMGRFVEENPVSYQGDQKVVTAFVVEDQTARFDLGDYDTTKTLIIDPARQWGTYYGGSGSEDASTSTAVDSSGNIYLMGSTESTTAISTLGGYQNTYGGGFRDAFVVKFNTSGIRQWGTYYGGNAIDRCESCTVGDSDNLYLAGWTQSTTSIATSDGHQNTFIGSGQYSTDAFLVKFNTNGVLQWGTYYGGSGNDKGYSCTLDANGNVYLAGETTSDSAIATSSVHQHTYGGGQNQGDAFLVKFDTIGTRLWSTYYGGSNSDVGGSCIVDDSGNVYLAGNTRSTSSIATSGGHQNSFGGGNDDAFLVKFNTNGTRLWSTYYGGSNYESGGSCIVDDSGNVYLAGFTESTSSIATSGGHQNSYGGNGDAFLVKFNTNGTRLWSTYYGGSNYESGGSCIVDDSGNVYLAGFTESNSAIATVDGYQNSYGGNDDAFLVKFNASGIRKWGTYYGGIESDYPHSCTVGSSGNVYLAGITRSTSTIATSGGYDNTFSGDSSGYDAFLVKFDGGCISTVNAQIDTITDMSCHGGSDAIIGISASGGTQPYNYYWSHGDTTPVVTGLPAGIYSVTVTDDNGCTSTTSDTITEPAPLMVSIDSSTSNSCNSSSDGSIAISVNGGTQPYAYNWSNGATNQDVSGLPAKPYNVTVTDTNGCMATTSDTITEPPPLAISVASSTNVSCNGGTDGSIVINVSGGTPSYNYNWQDGVTSQDRTSITAGTYSVTISDQNNCTDTIQGINITEPPALKATITSKSDVTCQGNTDGSIEIAVNGGTPGYSYKWQDGDSSQDRNGLAPLIYSVTVTDQNNCTDTLQGINVTEPDSLTISVNNKSDVSCHGGSDGTIDISVNGGTPSYNYNWSDGNSSQDRNSLTTGTYSLTVTDQNNCTETIGGIDIDQPSSLTISLTNQSNVTCNGGTDGSIDINVSGGTPSYNYNWQDGVASQDRTAITAGTYSVTISDQNNCTDTIQGINITEPTALTASLAGKSNVTCQGNTDGSIDISVNGGTPGYSYNWQDGNSSQDRNGLAPLTYSVTVTDQNNCTDTLQGINVSEPDPLEASVNSKSDVSCYGGSDGTIEISVNGGTPGYSYNWQDGASGQERTGITPGTYSVTVTDQNNCADTVEEIDVTEPSSLTTSLAEKSDVKCEGDGDGVINIDASGGTPPYNYTWLGNYEGDAATGLSTGTYQPTVTDNNGCQSQLEVTINADYQPQQPSISVTDDTLNVPVDYKDYQWYLNGEQLPEANENMHVADTTGYYFVIITDKNGCQAHSDTVEVEINDVAGVKIQVYPNPTEGKLIVTLNLKEAQRHSITVIDMLGRQVLPMRHMNSKERSTHAFDLSDQAAGLYLITIHNKETGWYKTRKVSVH